MNTKIVKYSICLYIIILGSGLTGFSQSLSGEVTTVAPIDNNLYGYYKDIAYNVITVAFCAQIIAVIYVVARNSSKAKKMVIQLIIAMAFTGILWAIL